MNDWHIGLVLLRNADSLPQALPMVQAILHMTLIICIPLVTVLPANSIRTGQRRQFEFTGTLHYGFDGNRLITVIMIDINYQLMKNFDR